MRRRLLFISVTVGSRLLTLTLKPSVFVSGPIDRQAKLPVVLWIHGGGSVNITHTVARVIAHSNAFIQLCWWQVER